MSVGRRWLDAEVYPDLLQLPGLFDSPGAHELADQYVLNRYFDGQVAALDSKYNFLVPGEALFRQLFNLALPDLNLLHFAGCSKPWSYSWDEARSAVPARFLRYYECWHELRAAQTRPLALTALAEYRAGSGSYRSPPAPRSKADSRLASARSRSLPGPHQKSPPSR